VVEPAEMLWSPAADAWEVSQIGRFLRGVEQRRGIGLSTYNDAWEWSVSELSEFWSDLWEFFDVRSSAPVSEIVSDGVMPDVSWFAGARLNYAEHALRTTGGHPAIVARSQSRDRIEVSWDDLRSQVGAARAGLLRAGVERGDRVAAYLPNVPETIVAFLATASLGAVFTTCAPEFGVQAVLDRFGQVEPKVLFVVDGYRYGTKAIDRRSEVEAIRGGLPTVTTVVSLSYLDPTGAPPVGAIGWDAFVDEPGELTFEQVPSDHPLYVLYSSGTTGLPKAIVHGHGGILSTHLKDVGLMSDIGPGDRFFWFSTTGWMMWNFLVSGLTVGSTVVLFDGDLAAPDLSTLWQLAAEERVTWFGASAPFYMACRKAGLEPHRQFDLGALRVVGSTGAPLPIEGFRWIYESVNDSVLLSSISGGTDICSAFVGGCPLVPVWAGEISARFLGCAVQAFDEFAQPVVGQQGELVITAPLPSMPVGFWNDADGSKYRSAYFDVYPGVWRHGDWITISQHGSSVISGRSDATLNRSGVRIGTSEIYRVTEAVAGVADSLIVHLEDASGEGPGELVLFVAVSPGTSFGDDLIGAVRAALRSALSPRHVPDVIYELPSIPTTLSGKKLELPVKKILRGADPDAVASRGALRDPAALDAVAVIAADREG
jgi:acetoacetyl-CoA synthetase